MPRRTTGLHAGSSRKTATKAPVLGGRLLVIRNVLKAWALLLGACALLGLIGWTLGGYRLLSIFVFIFRSIAGQIR